MENNLAGEMASLRCELRNYLEFSMKQHYLLGQTLKNLNVLLATPEELKNGAQSE